MKKKEEQIGQNVINVNVPGQPNGGDKKSAGKYVTAFKDAFNFLAGASFLSVVKVASIVVVSLIISMAAIMSYRAVTSDAFMDALANKITQKSEEKEAAHLDIRDDKVTPKIQKEIEILCYTLNADRVFIFEMHNGKKNSSGLPFRYADMSYEEVNDSKHIDRVAMKYQNVPLTLYKFPHYVAEHGYMFGNIGDVAKVDVGFADEISEDGGNFVAIAYITSNGTPLGFLGVAFHEKPEYKNEYIRGIIESHARVITPLLDLRMQIYWK
jgi:hypothetical protein